MKLPTAIDFYAAIGKDTTSPELKFLFQKLDISEENLDDENLDIPGRRIWSSTANGLQLNFKDIGLLQNIPYHNIDEGPWVLTDVIFWGAQENQTAYKGSKPYELDYTMSRDTVRDIMSSNNLGAPTIMGISGNVDTWTVGTNEIRVNYSGKNGIRSIAAGISATRNKTQH